MITTATALPDPLTRPEVYDGVLPKRAFAWVIDTVLIAALTLLAVLATALTGLFILTLLFMTIGFVYRWVSLTSSSATPGMRLYGLRLLTREATPFDAATAFLHTLGYTVSMSFVLPQVISIGSMLLSPRGQGLTDHILGTAALNRAALPPKGLAGRTW